MTYGDLPFQAHQEQLEKLVLGQFSNRSPVIEIVGQKPFSKKQRLVVDYQTSLDPERSAHAIWGWVFGNSTDADSLMLPIENAS